MVEPEHHQRVGVGQDAFVDREEEFRKISTRYSD